MYSAPSARGRGERDCVWGCGRPVCGVWVSRVATLLMFSAPSARGQRVRDYVWGCIGGVCGAGVYPRYVFAALGTRPACSRLCAGLCVACVRGVGARVGTLVVLLHDLRACHSADVSGLVSQGGWRGTAPYLNFQAPNCQFPAHPLVSCAFGVVFGSSLPTIYLLRPYETPPRTGYFAEYFSFPLKWQAASSIC